MIGAEPPQALPEPLPERLCPSARCEAGALFLGIVGPDGRVGMLTPPLPVDAAFVAAAAQGRAPEKRFRFAGRCVEGACLHWTGERCGVIETAVSMLADHENRPLPACGIRHACRWFAQHGREACAICPLIVTEVPGDEM